MQLFFWDHKKCTAWGGVSGWMRDQKKKTNHIMGKRQTGKHMNVEINWTTATF